MTSIGARTRQVNSDTGYYIPVANCVDKIVGLPATVGGAMGACPVWAASSGTGHGGPISSLLLAGGGLLKDMGKTIISSTRVFRKVQLVVPSTVLGVTTRAVSTNGVGGASQTTAPLGDYFTAYIELGSEGSGTPTPVALFGR
jgi:hypothetical protein